MLLAENKSFRMWWPGTESNRRRQPFQGCALPTELPGLDRLGEMASPIVASTSRFLEIRWLFVKAK